MIIIDAIKSELQLNIEDDLLLSYIDTAVRYAEEYQKHPSGYYLQRALPPKVKEAIILLVQHLHIHNSGNIKSRHELNYIHTLLMF